MATVANFRQLCAESKTELLIQNHRQIFKKRPSQGHVIGPEHTCRLAGVIPAAICQDLRERTKVVSQSEIAAELTLRLCKALTAPRFFAKLQTARLYISINENHHIFSLRLRSRRPAADFFSAYLY
jgi:hypothetical protein